MVHLKPNDWLMVKGNNPSDNKEGDDVSIREFVEQKIETLKSVKDTVCDNHNKVKFAIREDFCCFTDRLTKKREELMDKVDSMFYEQIEALNHQNVDLHSQLGQLMTDMKISDEKVNVTFASKKVKCPALTKYNSDLGSIDMDDLMSLSYVGNHRSDNCDNVKASNKHNYNKWLMTKGKPSSPSCSTVDEMCIVDDDDDGSSIDTLSMCHSSSFSAEFINDQTTGGKKVGAVQRKYPVMADMNKWLSNGARAHVGIKFDRDPRYDNDDDWLLKSSVSSDDCSNSCCYNYSQWLLNGCCHSTKSEKSGICYWLDKRDGKTSDSFATSRAQSQVDDMLVDYFKVSELNCWLSPATLASLECSETFQSPVAKSMPATEVVSKMFRKYFDDCDMTKWLVSSRSNAVGQQNPKDESCDSCGECSSLCHVEQF